MVRTRATRDDQVLEIIPAPPAVLVQPEDGIAASADEQRRLERFKKYDPPVFNGLASNDALGFLEECHRILGTIGISGSSGVSFIAFQLRGAAYEWWRTYELDSPDKTDSLTWTQYLELFLTEFVPQSLRDAWRAEFEHLRQGATTVLEGYMSRLVHSALPAANSPPASPRSQEPYYAPPVSSAPPVWGAFRVQFSRPGPRYSQPPRPPRACFECGDSLVVDHVYRSCLVTVRGFETRADLLLLGMVDFNIIFGMDWLSSHYAILDCHAKTVTLAMPGIPCVEWSGTLDHTPSRVISLLNAQRMVEKRCDVYLAYVRDVSIDTPLVDSVPEVHDFLDVFLVDLSGMPPDRDIDFGIDLLPGTQTISIPLYRMSPPELKELKDQLQELLDKGFIRPSVSLWGAHVLFVKKKDGFMRMCIDYCQLNKALASQFVRLDLSEPSRVLACIVSQSSLFDRIREQKYDDPHLLVLKDKVQQGDARDVAIRYDGVLRMQGRICARNIDGLRELILEEAHSLQYSIHPGAAKTYQDLRKHY
ncbi:uncharacterized protein [Nicotiana sylvestris]|uniref:uncharacterized protein n=1 Tax=Nicotiana sylvestris TaxID=4096 RepID=UPI00388C567D